MKRFTSPSSFDRIDTHHPDGGNRLVRCVLRWRRNCSALQNVSPCLQVRPDMALRLGPILCKAIAAYRLHDRSTRMSLPLLRAISMRARARAHGVLNESRLLSEAVGRAVLLRAGFRSRSDARRLNDILIACRRLASPSSRQRLKRAVAPWVEPRRAEEWRQARIGWDRYYREFDLAKPELHTSLLLKAP